MFDLVIIDEASQCDVASALPLLMRAKRAMIIGDICQLNHITNISRGREDIIGKRAGLTEDDLADFSYRSRSCFSLAASRLQEEPIFLDLHFRSHPAIIGFPNQEFYDERLEFCSASRPPLGAKAITWESVDGKCSRGPNNKSFRNRDEARAVVDRVAAAFPEYEGLGVSVGVVTPFRAQNDLIRELLSKALGADIAQKITVGTVHRYQGDERDVIFFSPVIASPYVEQAISFASNPNLVNVAMTRAKRRFVVVGNREACVAQPGILADLSAYISRLDAGMYDSPVEEMLANALREHGVHAQTGQVAAGHRLDLAVIQGDRRLDIECDGAAFHTDHEHDEERDKAISDAGWEVLAGSAAGEYATTWSAAWTLSSLDWHTNSQHETTSSKPNHATKPCSGRGSKTATEPRCGSDQKQLACGSSARNRSEQASPADQAKPFSATHASSQRAASALVPFATRFRSTPTRSSLRNRHPRTRMCAASTTSPAAGVHASSSTPSGRRAAPWKKPTNA